MKRFSKPVLVFALLCTTSLAPSTTTLLGPTPIEAKQLPEQPEGPQAGDPEAWENPRWIDQPVVSPQEPRPVTRPARQDSLLRALFQQFLSILRELRG